MKKILAFLVLILLVLPTLVISQNLAGTGEAENITITKNITSGVNEALLKEHQISEGLQIPAQILFGIKGEISLSELIILLLIWAWIFVFIADILGLFTRGAMPWILSLIITLIIAITGTIRTIAEFVPKIGATFKFLGEWGAGQLILSILILIALIFLIHSLLTKFKNRVDLELKRQSGFKAGVGIAILKSVYSIFTRKDKKL